MNTGSFTDGSTATLGVITHTQYDNGFIYEYQGTANPELKFFTHAEGYVEPNGNNFDYIYQYKDHLGNIRLSYKDNNGTLEIVEENNYYPFGLKHKGYNYVINGQHYPYGFGGKEENDELGLSMLDFGSRMYQPDLGRWFTIDPKAEDILQVDLSPYNYSWNNPVNVSDPDGECPFCIGFIVGAAVDYVTQVAVNYAKGMTGSEAWTDVDPGSILISAVAGGATSGLSVIKTTTTTTKAVLDITIDVAAETATQLNEKGNVNAKDLLVNVAGGKALDKAIPDVKILNDASSSNKVKTAERKSDRAERVSSNSTPARQKAVKDAKSEVKKSKIVNNTVNAVNGEANNLVNDVAEATISNVANSNNSERSGSRYRVTDVRSMATKVQDNTRVARRRFK